MTVAEGAYLDHAASTPVMPEVLDAMLVHLRDNYANPSGIHRQARNERRAIDDARELLAELLGCAPGEIVFTSGGTEADNLAIACARHPTGPGHVVVSAIEHHAILHPAASIGACIAPVSSDAIIDLDAFRELVDRSTELISVMGVNNEVGTIQPIAQLTQLVRDEAPQAIIHCDAVQALAWCDLPEMTRSCDLVTISAHKVGGPKGIGALVVRSSARERMTPLMLGGSQERDLRPGTENVAGIVGMAAAVALTSERRSEMNARVHALRDRFVDEVIEGLPGVRETAPRLLRSAGNAHFTFPGIDNEEMLLLLDAKGVAASAGSSCASGALEPSHVLVAMGMTAEQARTCVRFTLGATTTAAEIDYAIGAVIDAYEQLLGGVVATK